MKTLAQMIKFNSNYFLSVLYVLFNHTVCVTKPALYALTTQLLLNISVKVLSLGDPVPKNKQKTYNLRHKVF